MNETPTIMEFGWKDASSPFYHRFICKPIEELLPKDGSPILDVGCGNGYFANELIAKGYCVYGIDISPNGIAIANRKNPGRFFVADAEKEALPDALKDIPFTTVISTEVVEHLFNPEAYVSSVCTLLKKNALKEGKEGVFILTTPYHGYIKNIVLAVCGKMDYHYSALWVGGHIKFWSVRTIGKLLSAAGFTNITFRGAGRCRFLWRHMIVRCRVE